MYIAGRWLHVLSRVLFKYRYVVTIVKENDVKGMGRCGGHRDGSRPCNAFSARAPHQDQEQEIIKVHHASCSSYTRACLTSVKRLAVILPASSTMITV